MASRVNTRFVLLLAVGTVAVVMLLGGLWVLRIRSDADRHVRIGDELMASGQVRDAYRSYRRAVRKQRANLDYLDKFEEALLQLRPTGRDDARELYQTRIAVLNSRIRARRSDPAFHLALLEELGYAARLSNDAQWWLQIVEAAEQAESILPETEPAQRIARRDGARAVLRRAAVVEDSDLEAAEADLLAVVEAQPDDDEAWAALVHGLAHWAAKRRAEGGGSRSETIEQRLDQAIADAMEAVPDGPAAARAVVLSSAMRRRDDPESVPADDFERQLDHLVATAATDDDPVRAFEAAQVLGAVAWLGRGDDAVAILERVVEDRPDLLAHRGLMAELNYEENRLDAAAAAARAIVEMETLPVSFESFLQHQYRLDAAALRVDVAHRRWELAEGDARDAAVASIESAVRELERLVTDPEEDPRAIRARGKLAYARGDYREAAGAFDRLARRPETASAEILTYAAFSLERINEPGLAYERMKSLAAAGADRPAVLYECARLAFRLNEFGEAGAWAERALAIDPEHAGARRIAGLAEIQLTGGAAGGADGNPLAKTIRDAQEALDAGDAATARATIRAALEVEPDNPALLDSLLRVELSVGDADEAKRVVDRLLALQPQNPQWLQLKANLDTEDPIEAVAMYVDMLDLDETERAVRRLVNYAAVGTSSEVRAERLEETGEIDAAAAARALAERSRAAAEQAEAAVEAVAPDHPRLIEYRFRRALLARDWDEAQRVVGRAREVDADLAGGALFAGQLALLRGDHETAQRELEEAVRRTPHSSMAWRSLALAHVGQGRFGRAREAFERAYASNPNDLDTVRRYVALLVQLGDDTRALRVLRRAHRLAGADRRVVESWLALEARVGDPRVALRERLERQHRVPGDRANALALATFLATEEPTWDLVLDDTGEPVFSGVRWERLNTVQQRDALETARRGWHAQADAILDRIGDAGDVEVAALRARLLYERGRADEGVAALRSAAAAADEDAALDAQLALARFQVDIGRPEEALATLDGARDLQDPEARQVDAAIGAVHFEQGRYREALAALERGGGATGDNELRAIECLLRLGEHERAQVRLEARLGRGEAGYTEQMLRAAIADAWGAALARAGDDDRAAAHFEQRDAAIDAAAALRPSSPQPYIFQAQSLVRAFQREAVAGDPGDIPQLRRQSPHLDAALRALQEADRVQAGDPQTSLTRVLVLEQRGDVEGAAGELVRVLEANPDDRAARRRLVQLRHDTGQFDAALRVLRAGLERNPGLAEWHELEGDLHLDRMQRLARGGDQATREIATLAVDAARAYDRGLQIDPSAARLRKLVGALLAAEPPRHREAADRLADFPDLLAANAGLQSVDARLQHALGRPEIAQRRLAEAWGPVHDETDIAAQAVDPLADWQRSAEAIFEGRSPAELEAFVEELAGGAPSALDLQWLALQWARSGTDGLSRALELQRRAIDRLGGADPDRTAAMYFRLAGLLIQAGQESAALDPLKRVVQIQPRNIEALNNLAYLLGRLERASEAVPYAQQLEGLVRPELPASLRSSVLDTIGWIHHLAGDRERAERLLRESVQARESSENLLHLGTVLAEAGRADAALTRLERAIELAPDPATRAEIESLAADLRTRSARP